MDDEERGLLEAIAERPEADLNRSIYADWLEDHADSPRAEFVRIQLSLARLDEDHPDRVALLTRERGLLWRYELAWTLGLRHLCDGWTFRRGFVQEVVIQRPLTAAQYNELFAWRFVHRLSAPRQGWRLFPGLVEAEAAAQLEELHIASTPLEWQHVRALLECPRLQRLRSLELIDCRLGLNAMQRLARSDLLGRLRTLILRGNPLGTEGTLTLLRSPRIGTLRHLDLSECGVSGHVAQEVAALSLLGGLTTLRLREGLFDEASLAALLGCPHLARLADLDLAGGQAVGPDAWHPLFDGGPSPLRRLSLERNHLSRSQVFDLLSSPRLAGLSDLDLKAAVIYDDGSSWTGPKEVPTTSLDLDLSGLGADADTMVELLSHVAALERVRRLGLRFIGTHEVIFPAVLASSHLGNLRHLDLGGCVLEPFMLARLLTSSVGRQLKGLDLSRCYLSEAMVVELATEFPQLANLTWLSLRNNFVGSCGAQALARSPYLHNLRHLDLAECHIDDEGAVSLARADHLGSPVVLNVAGNPIGSAGRAALLGAAERAFERGVTIPLLDA